VSAYGRLVAACYNRWYEPAEEAGLADLRRAQLEPAAGRVLEIGAGTGLNLPYYPDAVEELVVAEPDPPMLKRLVPRLADVPARTSVSRAPAEELPFDDGSFDAVVTTFVLCTVRSTARSLAEVRRVLRPGGRLLFLEHVRSEHDPRLARWQDRLRPIWLRVGYGCNCNRRTLQDVEASGFEVESVRSGDLPKALPLWRPYVLGAATAG
jgi:ubiquinone/menaquinone biosynthesis C-methylase UbiE